MNVQKFKNVDFKELVPQNVAIGSAAFYGKLSSFFSGLVKQAEDITEGKHTGEIIAVYPKDAECIIWLIEVLDGVDSGKVIRKYSRLTTDTSKKFFREELSRIGFKVSVMRSLIENQKDIQGLQISFFTKMNDQGYPVYYIEKAIKETAEVSCDIDDIEF